MAESPSRRLDVVLPVAGSCCDEEKRGKGGILVSQIRKEGREVSKKERRTQKLRSRKFGIPQTSRQPLLIGRVEETLKTTYPDGDGVDYLIVGRNSVVAEAIERVHIRSRKLGHDAACERCQREQHNL